MHLSHSSPGTTSRRRRSRLLTVVLTAVALVGGTGLAATPASAAGVLPSTTTVAVSSPWIATGQSVQVTASVKVLGLPGLLVTPTGNVTFSSPGAASVTTKLGTCLLKVCTATAMMELPLAGERTVTATYAGDLLAAASSGSKVVTVYEPAGEFAASSTTCPATDRICMAGASTNDVDLYVNDVRSSTERTVNAALITGNAPTCEGESDLGTPWALFSSTSADARKFVDMEFEGAQATALAPLDDGELSYQWYGCFTSDKPFNGYVGGGTDHNAGSLVPAPLVGGFYQAKLPACLGDPYLNSDSGSIDGLDPASPVPCVTLGYSDDEYFGTYLRISIVTGPGDPKYVPS
jgi:hypothetical protein